MPVRRPTRLAATLALGAALMSGFAAHAVKGDRRLSVAVDLGRGGAGELCRAERAWSDPAAPGLFDRAYAIHCRGWTDTQSAGRLYAVDATVKGAATAIDLSRDSRMACGDPAPITIAGLGAGSARRCVEREAGYPAFALTVHQGRTLYEIEALDRFNAIADASLPLLTGHGALPKAEATPTATLALGTAKPPSGTVKASEAIDEMALQNQRGEIIGYSVRGQNVEAREIATRYSARLGTNATPSEEVNFELETALSESNLGYADVALETIGRAGALLDGAQIPTSYAGAFLRAKLHVYRGLLALNRRDYATALAEGEIGGQQAGVLAGSTIAEAGKAAEIAGDPLKDAATVRALNVQGSDRTIRSSITAPGQLVAMAHYERAASYRRTGQLDKAKAELADAIATLDRVESVAGGGGLEWAYAQALGERAAVAEAENRPDEARVALTDAVARLERSNSYAGSPRLASSKLALAGFLATHGDRAGAMNQYAGALTTMIAGGPSAAAAGNQLEGYFTLLAEDARGADPAAAQAAKEQFFIASQLVNPPAVAAQIVQLQKIFEGGSSDAAVRAKSLQDLDREARALAGQIAVLAAGSKERTALQAQLDDNAARTLEVRRELAGDQQYLQANDSPVKLAELQVALKPGEAYAKMLTLPRASYMVVATHDAASIYPAALPSADLTALVGKVRKSIDGHVAPDGHVVPLVFDVDSAAKLYDALLGPAQPLLAGTHALITEPTGAMTELPFGVLVGDKQSVTWFDGNVKINSRDYTKVAFLASRYDLDTTVSPRAFLVTRAQTPSRAREPYIGFGHHAQPDAAELEALPTRGALAGRCAVNAPELREAFAGLKSIGANELAAASALAGAGSQTVEDGAFTDTALDGHRDYRDFAVVHFATHGLKEGELECDNPPALITSIADNPQSDGLLSFEEIANLQFDANLVVLSACNTAAEVRGSSTAAGFTAGFAGKGATLNGLVRAFLVAGSRAVLTTHWAIPDSFRTRDGREVAASTQLIDTFFKAGRTSSIADALKTAQQGMIDHIDTSHPYYWAAFAIVGDGDKQMFARAS